MNSSFTVSELQNKERLTIQTIKHFNLIWHLSIQEIWVVIEMYSFMIFVLSLQ